MKDLEDEDKSVAPTEGVSETRSETSVGTRVPAEELSKNGEVQPGITEQATPGDEEVLQGAVEPIPVPVPATVKSEESAVETTEDTKNISPPVLSAIRKYKDVDESAAPTEEVSKTRSEEAVECEHNTITEQSAESVPTDAEDYLLRELNINDALEPVNDLEAKAVQGKYSDRGIKLTDALDVQPPTVHAVPKPVEDPEQSELSEQAKMNQSDDAHITEMSQKPNELLRRRTSDVKAVCSFCDRIIDGKTKLTLSEPAVICHPECLKCSVCAKTLGDLLTRMFLYHQGIHCDDCFANALVA
ncbi:titin-like isoform X1 [Solea senegalensis]|uniref:Titin-like isoform X1 n=1 Tax=Solea senegalensis TaxID=28829 RepID=A0AAV6SH10_SOLSE|nr:sciellin [Solea senegalensis]KAG7516180.1 titin-like isoform X1 [Solea senegalensis]